MKLDYPLPANEKFPALDALSFHRPTGRNMKRIAPHLPIINEMGAKLASNLPDDASQEEKDAAVAERDRLATEMMGKPEMFDAMMVIVGELSDIGADRAGDLDFADLQTALTEAVEIMGEAGKSNGAPGNGASH